MVCFCSSLYIIHAAYRNGNLVTFWIDFRLLPTFVIHVQVKYAKSEPCENIGGIICFICIPIPAYKIINSSDYSTNRIICYSMSPRYFLSIIQFVIYTNTQHRYVHLVMWLFNFSPCRIWKVWKFLLPGFRSPYSNCSMLCVYNCIYGV